MQREIFGYQNIKRIEIMERLGLTLPKSVLRHKLSLKRLTEFDDGLDGGTSVLRDLY
jgi:hypothetical protein